RHDEYRRIFFREPRQESAKNARGGSAVTHARTLRTSKRLVYFIHPKNRRGNRFGHCDRATHVFLGGADQAAEHAPHVEPQQRKLPLIRDCFGTKALAAALHPEHENSLGRRQTEGACFLSKGHCALIEPIL